MHLNLMKTIFLICIALPIISFGQTEWVQITGYYNDVYFDSPSVGWVAGSGVVRKTTDGGETWKTVLSDYEANITRIEFGEGGGTGYGISSLNYNSGRPPGNGSLYYATQGGSKWEKITLNKNYGFRDVSIDYDAQEGYQIWLASDETVHYSKGFTNNFIERRNGIDTNHTPLRIKFIDHDIGWVMASGWDTVSKTRKDYLYHTTDGGLNWNKQFEFENFTVMWFSIGGVGVVANQTDNTPFCYLTNDFGNTWDKLQLPEMQYSKITDIIMEVGSPKIWISGGFRIGDEAGSLIYCETDWYDNWQIDSTSSDNSSLFGFTSLNALCLPSPSDGRNMFIAGNDIYHSKTTDYERNWTSAQFKSIDYQIHDIYFFDSNNGISVGSHFGIMKTTDAGDNWQQINFDKDSYGYLYKIFFLDDSTGWACGTNGIIFKTEDTGTTWTYTYSGASRTLYDIYFVNENRGIAVGGDWDGQSIVTTNDGGASWDVKEKTNYSDVLFDEGLRAIFFISDTEGWIAGLSSVMHTTDAGNTWEETCTTGNNFTESHWTNSLYFFDENNGIAAGGGVGPGTQFWRTTDAGVTWVNQWSHPGFAIYDMEFSSPTLWAITGSDIYKSNNFGFSWAQDATNGIRGIGTSISMIDQNTGFIAGGRTFWRRQTPILTSIDLEYEHNAGMPQDFSLSQNYPNPFNPSTQINYSLPVSGNVKLIVYDILGREVKTLVNEFQNAGSYSIDFNAERLSSGIYFYRLSTGQFSETKKLLLLR